MKIKTFVKFFVVFFILFTAIITPLAKSVAEWNPFIGEISIKDEMTPVIVDENSPFFEAFRNSNRINMLLLGVNHNMTDTIMLASFDTKANHIDIISVPRDTYYEREGYRGAAERKINAIYSSQGLLETAYAVSDVLQGIPINYYAIVGYDAVRNIVNGIGGVPMTIEKPMKYKDPYDTPPLVIDIPAGEQILDGEHAVQFLRYRKGYSEGDIGRVKAQQEFVVSAFKQALKYGLIKSAKLVCDNLESDLTVGTASRLAINAVGLGENDIATYLMPGYPETKNGASYYFRQEDEIKDLLYQIYQLQPETAEGESGSEGADGTGISGGTVPVDRQGNPITN